MGDNTRILLMVIATVVAVTGIALVSVQFLKGNTPIILMVIAMVVSVMAMALAGVYLGGGIAPRILEGLKQGTFEVAFNSKGRMQETMSHIPVFVILNDRAALLGGASAGVNRATSKI